MARFYFLALLFCVALAPGTGSRFTRSLIAGAGSRSPPEVDWSAVHTLDAYGSAPGLFPHNVPSTDTPRFLDPFSGGIYSLPVSGRGDSVLDARPQRPPQQPALSVIIASDVAPTGASSLPSGQYGVGLEPASPLGDISVSHTLGVSAVPSRPTSPTATLGSSFPGSRVSTSSPHYPSLPIGSGNTPSQRGVAGRPGPIIAGPLQPASGPLSRVTSLEVIV